MASGVKVNKECTELYEKMKMNKHKGEKIPWIIYRISDDKKEIIVDRVGEAGESYEEFKECMVQAEQQGQCRYGAYDLDYTVKGAAKDKILFITWNPDCANIKNKMLSTSSKDYLKKALKLTVEVQATDMDELSMEQFIEKASRHTQA